MYVLDCYAIRRLAPAIHQHYTALQAANAQELGVFNRYVLARLLYVYVQVLYRCCGVFVTLCCVML